MLENYKIEQYNYIKRRYRNRKLKPKLPSVNEIRDNHGSDL